LVALACNDIGADTAPDVDFPVDVEAGTQASRVKGASVESLSGRVGLASRSVRVGADIWEEGCFTNARVESSFAEIRSGDLEIGIVTLCAREVAGESFVLEERSEAFRGTLA